MSEHSPGCEICGCRKNVMVYVDAVQHNNGDIEILHETEDHEPVYRCRKHLDEALETQGPAGTQVDFPNDDLMPHERR